MHEPGHLSYIASARALPSGQATNLEPRQAENLVETTAAPNAGNDSFTSRLTNPQPLELPRSNDRAASALIAEISSAPQRPESEFFCSDNPAVPNWVVDIYHVLTLPCTFTATVHCILFKRFI